MSIDKPRSGRPKKKGCSYGVPSTLISQEASFLPSVALCTQIEDAQEFPLLAFSHVYLSDTLPSVDLGTFECYDGDCEEDLQSIPEDLIRQDENDSEEIAFDEHEPNLVTSDEVYL